MSKSKNKRQQNSEIDRVLRQIDEGLDEFESMWGEFSVNSKQEQQLRSQLQKLQKLRSQVRVWLDDPTLKEYHTRLQNARVLIEAEMRRFKVSEKSIRSKGGDEDYCTGPRAAAIAWADHCCTKIQVEITKLEDEGGKKQKRLREQQAGAYKEHLEILQRIRQGLEESVIEADDIEMFKDQVDEFIESISSGYQDLDFEIYDQIIEIIDQGGHNTESSDSVRSQSPKFLSTTTSAPPTIEQPQKQILIQKQEQPPSISIGDPTATKLTPKIMISPPKTISPEAPKPVLKNQFFKIQPTQLPIKKQFAVTAPMMKQTEISIQGEHVSGLEIMNCWKNGENIGLITNVTPDQQKFISENQLYSNNTKDPFLQYQLEMIQRSLKTSLCKKMLDLDNQIMPRSYQNQEIQLSNPELNQRLEKARKIILKDPLGSQAINVPQIMKMCTPGEQVTQQTCLTLETKIFDQIPAETAFYVASTKNKSRDQYLAGLSLKNRDWHFAPLVGRWFKTDSEKLQFYELGEGIKEVEQNQRDMLKEHMFNIM